MSDMVSLKAALPPLLPGQKENFERIIIESLQEYLGSNTYVYNPKVQGLAVYKKEVTPMTDNQRVDFMVFCIDSIFDTLPIDGRMYNDQAHYQLRTFQFAFVNQLIKPILQITDQHLAALVLSIYGNDKWHKIPFNSWPVSQIIQKLEKQYLEGELSDAGEALLNVIRMHLVTDKAPYHEKEILKLTGLIDAIVFRKTNQGKIRPVYFQGDDDFSQYANPILKTIDKAGTWFQVMELAQSATGSSPSKKYLAESKKLIDELGEGKFKATTFPWFEFVIGYKEKTEVTVHTYGGQEYRQHSITFLSGINLDTLKGIVWMCSHFNDTSTLLLLSSLAIRCFKKIPNKGAPAVSLGNACLYSLFQSEGLGGISQLSRLQVKIKQSSTQTLIKKYLETAAEKMGVGRHEIEDIAVDDLGIKNGVKEYQVGDYMAKMEIAGIGKSNLRWFKSNGAEQKSVPASVKEEFAEQLIDIKRDQKQLDQSTAAQRERFDRMLRSDRVMTMDYFIKQYIDHGLLSYITKKLIWNFSNDTQPVSALYFPNGWVNAKGEPVDITSYKSVSLWHPVTSPTEEVKQWRSYLLNQQIQQPIKQAYREINLLTPAEINTGTYSNRMAAHVLKQHQYVSLAKTRNWNAKLIGAWDGGDDNIARLELSEYDLRAEYWINALDPNAGETSDSGIWKYITTDQVRFLRNHPYQVIPLTEVPAVVFSEVMRDVDLFVGVASVGNDPTWQDTGGLPQYRDYWNSVSFGDLNEVAKTRKELLAGLLPKLKIASVCELQERFLVVKGKLRIYKIHLGSTNILMEPNDQYLCIVEDRTQRTSAADKVFLPFEGDVGFSLILSKAFLLAADDKIEDRSILVQIERK